MTSVPRGTYLHLDGGRRERFQCAPGPGGWRYVSTAPGRRVDIAVDSRWRQVRVQITAGDWRLRGGLAGRELLWVRSAPSDPSAAVEQSAQAAGFLGESPGFLVAVARSLRLTEGHGVDVPLVRVSTPALAAITVRYRWALADVSVHTDGDASLPVERYDVTDVDTGERHSVHLAGDVVLDAPGIELADLDGPPTGVEAG